MDSLGNWLMVLFSKFWHQYLIRGIEDRWFKGGINFWKCNAMLANPVLAIANEMLWQDCIVRRFNSVFHSMLWLVSFHCRFIFYHITEKQNCVTVAVKASGESSESSTSLTVFKSVQNVVSTSVRLLYHLCEQVKFAFARIEITFFSSLNGF